MNINKQTQASIGGEPTAQQLEAINAQAKSTLTGEQVYVFSLRLCDDQVDRDYERFDTAALPALAKLFIGKTGVVDHKWSADKQIARIFETQVVKEDGVSYIKAWALMASSCMAVGAPLFTASAAFLICMNFLLIPFPLHCGIFPPELDKALPVPPG